MSKVMHEIGSSARSTCSRKQFLQHVCQAGMGFCAVSLFGVPAYCASTPAGLKEASFYRRLSGQRTQCMLCPNSCVREDGKEGRCHARRNYGGTYYSLVYGDACVIALDEVAKCPLYHFDVPGKAFSIATAGCNLTCHYCQNWEFSQYGPSDVAKSYKMSPQQVVDKARENNAGAVAFFYTEPTVYYEYMLDIAKLAHRSSLQTIMVTAGYIQREPLLEVLPHIDAVAIGLKGWDEDYYRQYIGGELAHVKDTIQILADTDGVWWEVVNLIAPSLNDSMEDIVAMSRWLHDTAGPERPLHFTRFRPMYRLKRLPMTPAATLTKARETAQAQGLKHVYVGNLPGHEGANTYCPGCGKMIVERLAFDVLHSEIKNGCCGYCGRPIEGVWK